MADQPFEGAQELLDGISDYVHGDAREQIAANFADAGEQLYEVMAAISYEILGQVSGQSPEAMDIEDLFYLATETIDMLIEVAEAVGAPIGDMEEFRGKVLISVVQLHMAAVQDDPEQKAIAEELLAELTNDGTFDTGMDYVNRMIEKEGGDPGEAEYQGIQMGAQGPQQDPLAQGVQQGLQQPPQGGGLLGGAQ